MNPEAVNKLTVNWLYWAILLFLGFQFIFFQQSAAYFWFAWLAGDVEASALLTSLPSAEYWQAMVSSGALVLTLVLTVLLLLRRKSAFVASVVLLQLILLQGLFGLFGGESGRDFAVAVGGLLGTLFQSAILAYAISKLVPKNDR